MMLKQTAGCAIVTSSLLLIACPQRSAVWVEPGSTARHFVIGVGALAHGPPPANLYGLTVVRCGDENKLPESAVWAIARISEGSVPDRVVFGIAPPGFETRVQAQALLPGCYRVQDSGSGRMEIVVAADGAIRMR
jgi:hypothetical protein